MHPILGEPRRLVIYLLAFLVVGLLLIVGLPSGTSWLAAALLFLPLTLVYAFISLSAWYVCLAFPLHMRTSAPKLIGVHLGVGAMASAILIALGTGWAALLDSLFNAGTRLLFADQWALLFIVGTLLYWLAAIFHYLLIAFEASREADKRALELSLLAREAELKALRAQIDPHFIFNSLHSISALTSSDAAAARRMCLLLADFLRETLRLGSNTRISLADEFALAERFLAIEQVRLGSRLQVTRNTEPAAVECLVPPLLLQPLVENAVVHGVAQLVEGGTIAMAAMREGSTLTITLENPCDPDRARTRGVGLGLDLLKKRLTTQFGSYDAVHAQEQSGRFRVEVRLPAVTTV
jgi:LytS/YehU family sensor histidine kinase